MEEIQQIQNRLLRLETILLPQAREVASSGNNSTESLYSLQPQSPSPSSSLLSGAASNGASQCLPTLTNPILPPGIVHITEEDIYAEYFKHVGKWLPIISQKKFYKQLTGNRSMNRRPEADLLVSCMYLLVKDPANLEPSEAMHNHYKRVRSTYFMLQAESMGGLELAQSGLMLATFEHASGHIEPAYATIWTCIRMMHSLRLENKFRASIDNNHDEETECAEAHALWWAIIIRDR